MRLSIWLCNQLSPLLEQNACNTFVRKCSIHDQCGDRGIKQAAQAQEATTGRVNVSRARCSRSIDSAASGTFFRTLGRFCTLCMLMLQYCHSVMHRYLGTDDAPVQIGMTVASCLSHNMLRINGASCMVTLPWWFKFTAKHIASCMP